MRLPKFVVSWLQHQAIAVSASRDPDVVIGENYLLRWHVIPRNTFFNIYLHCFLGSDDDRAHHCHPWANLSCLIGGRYIEHTIAAGGTHHQKMYYPGALKFRTGAYAHRIEILPDESCWTFFITGPKYREWYFHCKKRLVHWRDFTNPNDTGQIGAGCGEG